MSFDNLPASKPAPRRAKGEAVFCVGWRAFVNWQPRGGQPLAPLPLTNAEGNPVANDLADGQEVEIVAWRPRAREGLSYRVRRLADSSEWWIGAMYLRRLRDSASQAPASGKAFETAVGGRLR